MIEYTPPQIEEKELKFFWYLSDGKWTKCVGLNDQYRGCHSRFGELLIKVGNSRTIDYELLDDFFIPEDVRIARIKEDRANNPQRELLEFGGQRNP